MLRDREAVNVVRLRKRTVGQSDKLEEDDELRDSFEPKLPLN